MNWTSSARTSCTIKKICASHLLLCIQTKGRHFKSAQNSNPPGKVQIVANKGEHSPTRRRTSTAGQGVRLFDRLPTVTHTSARAGGCPRDASRVHRGESPHEEITHPRPRRATFGRGGVATSALNGQPLGASFNTKRAPDCLFRVPRRSARFGSGMIARARPGPDEAIPASGGHPHHQRAPYTSMLAGSRYKALESHKSSSPGSRDAQGIQRPEPFVCAGEVQTTTCAADHRLTAARRLFA